MKCAILLLALIFGSCGATNKDGTCKDYTPAMSCPAGYDYTCETNKDGCKVCSCVRNEDVPAAPFER